MYSRQETLLAVNLLLNSKRGGGGEIERFKKINKVYNKNNFESHCRNPAELTICKFVNKSILYKLKNVI